MRSTLLPSILPRIDIAACDVGNYVYDTVFDQLNSVVGIIALLVT